MFMDLKVSDDRHVPWVWELSPSGLGSKGTRGAVPVLEFWSLPFFSGLCL